MPLHHQPFLSEGKQFRVVLYSSYNPYDSLSAVGDSIQSGKSATLSCSVVNQTDTLTVAWYDKNDQVVPGTIYHKSVRSFRALVI